MNVFCGRKFAKIWLFVLLAFTSLLGAYELKGVVKDAASGGPLESCYIIVYNLQGTVLYGETTDIDGAYSIFGINEGNYMVEANHVAYGVVTIQVKISNRPYVLDFELSEALGSTDIIVVSAGRRAEKLSDASANIQVVEAKPYPFSRRVLLLVPSGMLPASIIPRLACRSSKSMPAVIPVYLPPTC